MPEMRGYTKHQFSDILANSPLRAGFARIESTAPSLETGRGAHAAQAGIHELGSGYAGLGGHPKVWWTDTFIHVPENFRFREAPDAGAITVADDVMSDRSKFGWTAFHGNSCPGNVKPACTAAPSCTVTGTLPAERRAQSLTSRSSGSRVSDSAPFSVTSTVLPSPTAMPLRLSPSMTWGKNTMPGRISRQLPE